MSNSADAARKIGEPSAHQAVRQVLDTVKAEKRTSLTAPEGKLVCDAYGIPVPKEGVAKSAADAAKIASGMGFISLIVWFGRAFVVFCCEVALRK